MGILSPAQEGASKFTGEPMRIKKAIQHAGVQGRVAARRGLERAADFMHRSSRLADRVVCNPEPEELEPEPPRAKPIVSVNGHDVDPAFPEENLNLPENERPAA
jgi:hypothetical protein